MLRYKENSKKKLVITFIFFHPLSIAAIPVVVDHWQNTVTAGGVVIHGLHATVAPRRSQQAAPVLEGFTFVPYMDTVPHSLSTDLNHYAADVFTYAIQGLKKLVGTGDVCNSSVLAESLSHFDAKGSLSMETISSYLQTEEYGLLKVCVIYKIFF